MQDSFSSKTQVMSKTFSSKHGRDVLIHNNINVKEGPSEERMLLTEFMCYVIYSTHAAKPSTAPV